MVRVDSMSDDPSGGDVSVMPVHGWCPSARLAQCHPPPPGLGTCGCLPRASTGRGLGDNRHLCSHASAGAPPSACTPAPALPRSLTRVMICRHAQPPAQKISSLTTAVGGGQRNAAVHAGFGTMHELSQGTQSAAPAHSPAAAGSLQRGPPPDGRLTHCEWAALWLRPAPDPQDGAHPACPSCLPHRL